MSSKPFKFGSFVRDQMGRGHAYLCTSLMLCTFLVPAFASEATAERQADWAARMVTAQAQQQEGKKARVVAKQLYEAEKKTCFKKFRVTDCQEDARRIYITKTSEARRIENQGLMGERHVKKEELADKDARFAAEAPQREAELRQRAIETASERAESELKRIKRLADKESRAAQGKSRHAKDLERQKNKREKHDREVAEKLEKAKRRAAESNN